MKKTLFFTFIFVFGGTTIVEHPKGGIKLGDMIIFKGYISSAADLDKSGDLESLIGSKAILLALRVERAH